MPHIGAQKILIGQRLFAATADTQFGHAAIPWKKGIVHRTVAQMPIQHQSLIDLVQAPFWVFGLPVASLAQAGFRFAEDLITAYAYFFA